MSRTVFCVLLNKEADGLDFQLYPGLLYFYSFLVRGHSAVNLIIEFLSI
jgi:hypothetical protein